MNRHKDTAIYTWLHKNYKDMFITQFFFIYHKRKAVITATSTVITKEPIILLPPEKSCE